MKKIISILILITCFGFIGCSDDNENPYAVEELIITKADVLYHATGGTGVVEIQTNDAITATPIHDWCTAIVSGNKISLEIPAYDGLESRNTILTIKAGGKESNLTITQESAILWFDGFDVISKAISFTAEGGIAKAAVKSSYPVDVTDKPDWLTYEFKNDSVYINIAPWNNPRQGSVTFRSNNREISYQIMQFSYASLLGEWEFSYATAHKGARQTPFSVSLSEKVKEESYTFGPFVVTSKLNSSFTANYKTATQSITLQGPEYLGIIPDDLFPHAYMCLRSSTDNRIGTTSVQIEGVIAIDETGKVTCTFKDNGTYSSGTITGFGFFNWANQEFTGSVYRQKVFHDIIMTKK